MPTLSEDGQLIMGVVNITPDSFSDGGNFYNPKDAIRHCYTLLEQGADILDLGAESSRPGSDPVDQEEEWRRLSPVVSALTKDGLGGRLSVDTYHSANQLRSVEAGVKWINNIAGISTAATLGQIAAETSTKYIAMHMQGTPKSMQKNPLAAQDVLPSVEKAFQTYHRSLTEAGFTNDRIYLDPGIGFGKSDPANLRLLKGVSRLSQDFNILVGISRKSFIGRLLAISEPKNRDAPSKMLELSLWNQGAKIIRTHDVLALARIRDVMRQEC